MKIIATKIVRRDGDGKQISARTVYYKWTRDGTPVFAAKSAAAMFDDAIAEKIREQVAALSACCTGVSIGALLVERRFR